MSVQSQDTYAAPGLPLSVIGTGGGGGATPNPSFSTINVLTVGNFSTINVSSINGTSTGPSSGPNPEFSSINVLGNGAFSSVTISGGINGGIGDVDPRPVFSTLTLANGVAVTSGLLFPGSNLAAPVGNIYSGAVGDLSVACTRNMNFIADNNLTLNANGVGGTITMAAINTLECRATPNIYMNGLNLSTLTSGSLQATTPFSLPAAIVNRDTVVQGTMVIAGWRFTWVSIPINVNADWTSPTSVNFFSTLVNISTGGFSGYPFVVGESFTLNPTIQYSTVIVNSEVNWSFSTISIVGQATSQNNVQVTSAVSVLAIGPA